MPQIYIILVICIASTLGNTDADVRSKRQNKDAIDCLTASGTGGTCLPFQQCLTQNKRFRVRPTVCRWETIGPVICCPTASLNQKALTCGLSQAASRKRRQATFEDTETDMQSQDGFIVGGKDAVLGKWPWMALIFLEDDVERKFPICGGSLISEQTILTAAHCFLGRKDSKFIIRLGEHNLALSTDNKRPVDVKVQKVVTHSGFRYPALYDDIAVLHLVSQIRLTNRIQLVCLPNNFKTENFVGKESVVTGWGHLDFGGKRADILQELQLPVISNEKCQKKYDTLPGSKPNLPQGIIQKMLCAGIEDEKKDSCQGDSGGPLVFQTTTQNWVQIGIVSAGYECGTGFPGLYTRVTEYLDWISENTI